MTVDPWGYLLDQAREGVGHTTTCVELEYVAAVRQRFSVTDDRVLWR